MSLILLGILFGVLGAGWYGFERQKAVYEQLVRVLENDRDAARQEARVFRGLVLPSFSRVEASEGAPEAGESQRTAVSQKKPAQATQSFYRPARLPFRKLFNMERRKTNTPQQKTDALATALQKAQPKVPQQVPL